MLGTVAQIQVDQALVGNTQLFRHLLEIMDRAFIKPNGDLFFQLRDIRVFVAI